VLSIHSGVSFAIWKLPIGLKTLLESVSSLAPPTLHALPLRRMIRAFWIDVSSGARHVANSLVKVVLLLVGGWI
jgi:hypothetical protein